MYRRPQIHIMRKWQKAMIAKGRELEKRLAVQEALIIELQELLQDRNTTAATNEAVAEPAPKVVSTETRKALIQYFNEYNADLSKQIAAVDIEKKVDEINFLNLKRQVFSFNKLFSDFGIIDERVIKQEEGKLKSNLKPVFQKYIKDCVSDYIQRVNGIDIDSDLSKLEGWHSHIQDQADFFLEVYGTIAHDLKVFSEAYDAFCQGKDVVNSTKKKEETKPKESDKPKKTKSKGYSPQLLRMLQATTVTISMSALATTSLKYFYGEKVPTLAKVITAAIVLCAVCFAAFRGREGKSR